MNTEREERMRLLLRKAERARELEPFTQKLATATGLPAQSFHFLPLEETDTIKAAFDTWYMQKLSQDAKFAITWDEPTPLRQVLQSMAVAAEDMEVVVFFQDSDVLGALAIPASRFFPHGYQILIAAGDCIHAVLKDFSSGLILDFYEEGPTGIRYEAIAWGGYRTLLERSLPKAA